MKSSTSKIAICIGAGVLVALLVTKLFFIGNYYAAQNGMYPGLPVGSTLFVLKRAYSDASDVRRGDIVVFVRKERGDSYNYFWRVVALPGETVQASGEALTINGVAAQRHHVRETDDRKTIVRETIGDVSYDIAFDHSPGAAPADVSITVPPGHFFVMGDNRFDARDSRFFGPIPFHSIIGKKL